MKKTISSCIVLALLLCQIPAYTHVMEQGHKDTSSRQPVANTLISVQDLKVSENTSHVLDVSLEEIKNIESDREKVAFDSRKNLKYSDVQNIVGSFITQEDFQQIKTAFVSEKYCLIVNAENKMVILGDNGGIVFNPEKNVVTRYVIMNNTIDQKHFFIVPNTNIFSFSHRIPLEDIFAKFFGESASRSFINPEKHPKIRRAMHACRISLGGVSQSNMCYAFFANGSKLLITDKNWKKVLVFDKGGFAVDVFCNSQQFSNIYIEEKTLKQHARSYEYIPEKSHNGFLKTIGTVLFIPALIIDACLIVTILPAAGLFYGVGFKGTVFSLNEVTGMYWGSYKRVRAIFEYDESLFTDRTEYYLQYETSLYQDRF